MSSALSSQRSWIARIAVLAMVASLMAFGAAPAGAAIATDNACPASIPSSGFTDLTGLSTDAVGAIDCIADYGISTGTSATTFDPFSDVARWQMALFLTRQAEIHGVTLPDGSDQGFTDLGGLSAGAVTAINQTAQLGISLGTSATTFDPLSSVTRWQMALFLTRLWTAAGETLGDGSDQGFTDLTGLSADTVTAINQLAQLQISEGTSATTFDPASAVQRWAMALFLARTLEAGGITPAPTGGFIVVASASPDFDYVEGGEVKTAETDATDDTFSVDGSAATQGVFFVNLSVGDTVAIGTTSTGASYALTNVTNADTYTSGTIDDVGGASFDIIEPVSGAVLQNNVPFNTGFQLFNVDGSASTQAGFSDNAQAGDTVALTGGDGTAADEIQTISLTNVVVSGSIDALVAGTSLDIEPFADSFPVADTDDLTVDGDSVATAALFIPAGSEGDTATYSLNGGAVTATRTNVAPTASTGTANGDFAAGVSFDWDAGAGVATVTYDNAGTATFLVNGVLAAVGDFEAALSAGDTLEYTAPDTDTSTAETVVLTDGVITDMDVDDTTIVTTATLENVDLLDSAGGTFISIDYTTVPTGYTADGAPEYEVNGASATLAEFNTALDAVATGFVDGTLTVTDDGTDVVYELTTG